jgi:hypothetical protein
MFRCCLLVVLTVLGGLVSLTDAEACHRCRHRHGSIYGAGCGYYCHGGYGGGYRVVKVYRTVRVPVQTCSTTCATGCNPCNPCATSSASTCSTVYVTKRVLVHSQVVPPGPVYGRYADGTSRMVAGGYGRYGYGGYGRYGYGGYGYGAPYGAASGMGGGYRMGGYGKVNSPKEMAASYKAIAANNDAGAKRVGVAF